MPSRLITTHLFWGQVPDASALSPAGLVNAVVPLVGLIGVGVLLWGAYHALLQQLTLESPALRAQTKTDTIRLPFSHYLALGLEFMIAASAMKTLNDHSLQQVAVLGGMVLSRVLVGLYPRWDAKGELTPAATSAIENVPTASNAGASPVLAEAVADTSPTAASTVEAEIGNPSVVTLAS
jgi:uncharacterized membrane protein